MRNYNRYFILLINASIFSCAYANTPADSAGRHQKEKTMTLKYSKSMNDAEDIPLSLPVDQDGFISLFNGRTFEGWRGYGLDHPPARWTIDGGTLKLHGTGKPETTESEGGDLIFAHKFRNFELALEWKVSKGANSGIFYLAQEISSEDESGKVSMEPIYISAPEYQVLDNDNHPDARLGSNNNRKSASLYDMIPAVPQNAGRHGEWNSARIKVLDGTVRHEQNDKLVVQYNLWTPQWTQLLQASKFSKANWPRAFDLLNHCGGKNREGYIGLQDHGDEVWFRNIRIRILD